ncbi:Eisosome component PIL1-domain-containing protein [Scleroderma citrinum]
MFRSAATKIAHNTTIPALAGANPDLRPLQDLITAEKSVLVSLQKLSTDLAKASEALRIWGQGEGDDLGDILTASTTLLSHFSGALSTWASLHHTIRDNMKAVRTREEGLDDLRRRRRRLGASAESAEKKLHKMSPEHKNLGAQTETLNRLREEIRGMDSDIVREEAALSDLKRKCSKNWMTLKFGGLVECCEKGIIVGDMGKCIIKEISDDVTTPGLLRPPYTSRNRVNDCVVETQRAVSQVKFSGTPSGDGPEDSQSPPAPSRHVPSSHVTTQPIFAPPLGSDLTVNVSGYSTQPSRMRSTSVDELGAHRVVNEEPQPVQFSTLPARGRDPVPIAEKHTPLSLSTIENGATGAEPSLMASITDALSRSHRGDSIDQTTSIGHSSIDPVPKYEPLTVSEGHGHSGSRTSGDTSSGKKRATRRSTSPPVLPPGAAPAAIRAWDDGSSQGEDGAHSDRPASSSERASQQRISSSEVDGEEVGLAYDRDDVSREGEEVKDNDDKTSKIGGELSSESEHEHDTNVRTLIDTKLPAPSTSSTPTPISASPSMQTYGPGTMTLYNEASSKSNVTLHSRGGSQHRIPRVPPPALDTDSINTNRPPPSESPYDTPATEFTGKDSVDEEHARNVAAAREVSREFDALTWAAVSPINNYAPPPKTPQSVPGQQPASRQPSYEYSPSSPTRSPTSPLQAAQQPPSPLVPPNAPFGNRSGSPVRPTAPPLERPPSTYSDTRAPLPSPAVVSRGPLPFPQTSPRPPHLGTHEAGSGASTGQRSPIYRTPPEYPRPTPPFSSPAMSHSTSSLNGGGNGGPGTPRMISAAAFRRHQQGRSPSSSSPIDMSGPADTSPLVVRRQSPAPAVPPKNNAPTRRLSVVNPDPHVASDDEGDFDYIGAYGGSTAEGEASRSGYGHSPSSSQSQSQSMGAGSGYEAGKMSFLC